MKARKTTYNGIEMRSRLEARVAALLDRWGVRWEYEPRAFASQRGQYLPDFLIHDIPTPSVGTRPLARMYVDVKGAPTDAELLDLEERMELIWSSDPTAILAYGTVEQMEQGNWRVATQNLRWTHAKIIFCLCFQSPDRRVIAPLIGTYPHRVFVIGCDRHTEAFYISEAEEFPWILLPEYGT